MSTAVRPLDKAALDRSSGNFALIDTLRKWGVTFFSGVNGGGLIHVTKHLEPYLGLRHSGDMVPRMQTMGEYVAGFAPLGYYLASGRIAGCMTTTGAATKLGSSGITDAKLHNIPAVYVIALNSTLSIGRSPLQDVSEHGMNIVPQLRAELGDACIVLDDPDKMGEQLELAQSILAESKPVAIAFHPDVLSKEVDLDVPRRERPRMLDQVDADRFVNEFPEISRGRRVIIYAGAEASRCPGITPLTTQLSELLQAPTVWSVNGANAISPGNRYGYGYISFGGNDEAMKLWRSITPDDIVITLDFDSELHRSWRSHSIGFDDVCTAYKDRQYVAQRPHPSIPFHTVHDGSAMGGAFGLGVGARVADSSLHTFVFSGDGCWRLYGGALAEAANLGMNLFIINNERYAIVDKGLEVVIPDWDKERYHGVLQNIDFVAAAKAHGWDGHRLRADLGNLDEILNACYAASGKGRSVLVDVPIDADQVLGLNPRLNNLTTDTYL